MEEWQRILAIKTKKAPRPQAVYLTQEAIKLFLSRPDRGTKKGTSDLVMLSSMIESGARVQEIADLTLSMIHLGARPSCALPAKGTGHVRCLFPTGPPGCSGSIWKGIVYRSRTNEYPLFGNGRHGKLSRMGISAIVKKYADSARKVDPKLIPKGITPHSLRHIRAMLMIKSGVDIICIRDFLGHRSVTSTEIYARMDDRQKLDAINRASLVPADDGLPSWERARGLLLWLEHLGK